MKTRLAQLYETLRSSYWFWPSLLTLGAAALALLSTELDSRLAPDWMENVSWLSANQPEGARALLSTIAGSMITVAGVTFSITIAALVYTTSQFGPRLLTTFMRDRGNQLVLGTFLAAFAYCLLVLRTVRSAERASPGADAAAADLAAAFVPHVSILIALGLAAAGVAVLIYFIHHVPESVHISRVTAAIGSELLAGVSGRFPGHVGLPPKDAEAPPDLAGLVEKSAPIRADCEGYIQAVDCEGLIQVARESGLVVGIVRRPGEFASRRRALAWGFPAHRAVDEAVAARVRSCFLLGWRRSPGQDLLFPASELVEIAGRALSPGVNDPITANTCVSWLGSALGELARSDPPSPLRYDAHGRLRVVAEPVLFAEFASHFVDSLRPYAAGDRNAALHLLGVLAAAAGDLRRDADRVALRQHVEALGAECRASWRSDRDLRLLEEAVASTLGAIADPGHVAATALLPKG